jgi:hypothetical protein
MTAILPERLIGSGGTREQRATAAAVRLASTGA